MARGEGKKSLNLALKKQKEKQNETKMRKRKSKSAPKFFASSKPYAPSRRFLAAAAHAVAARCRPPVTRARRLWAPPASNCPLRSGVRIAQATFYMYVTCAFRDRGLKGYACSALFVLGLDDSGAPRPGARLRRWCRRGKRGRFPFMTPCGCRKCCGPPARAGLPASSSKDVVYTHIEHGGGSRPACERR